MNFIFEFIGGHIFSFSLLIVAICYVAYDFYRVGVAPEVKDHDQNVSPSSEPEGPVPDEHTEQIAYQNEAQVSKNEVVSKSENYYKFMNSRRTLRFFSSDPVPLSVIENLIRTAGTSPSGAHRQPWFFAVISNPTIKHQIRQIVEVEEQVNYDRRMGQKWVDHLKPFKTNWEKEYLDVAPYLIMVLKQNYTPGPNGKRIENYYTEISVSIAVGMLISAIHNAGLVTLTSTPMNAGPSICRLLDRPSHERVILLLPVGYPAPDATVPDLKRKLLSEIMKVY